MNFPWYVTAVGAAVIWGIHYPLIDFAMKRLSLFGVLLLGVIPIFLLTPFFLRELAGDVDAFKLLPGKEQWIILALTLTSTLGAMLVYLSISSKNAPLASLIEITYPLFVIFFSYLFFKQVHLSASVVIGGLLIFCGAAIIVYHNQ